MEKGLGWDARPWGFWWELCRGKEYRVRRVTVDPGQRLSYQRHRFREERWIFVEGNGLVILEGKRMPVERGDYVSIPKGALHRVENTGKSPLVFIEVQIGERLDEEDIERIEDDYGRT